MKYYKFNLKSDYSHKQILKFFDMAVSDFEWDVKSVYATDMYGTRESCDYALENGADFESCLGLRGDKLSISVLRYVYEFHSKIEFIFYDNSNKISVGFEEKALETISSGEISDYVNRLFGYFKKNYKK